MRLVWILLFCLALSLSACTGGTATPTPLPPATVWTGTLVFSEPAYYVSLSGSDTNVGTKDQPWRSLEKAVKSVKAGETVYVRGGEYATVFGGWNFANSGTASQPVTLTNYPGEQVVLKISDVSNLNYMAFRCLVSSVDSQTWQTAKADHIRILGTDVAERTLSNGVKSRKGLVIQGAVGEQSPGISGGGCDNWEVGGVDFVDVAYGIFTYKKSYKTVGDYSADEWYVHHNRVYSYYRESGMQFNGNRNRIEGNELYKVSDQLDTPFGCQMLNMLGNGNIIRGNTLSRLGSKADCGGLLFEWDLSDGNVVEQNLIYDVPRGLSIAGGDNNLIRNNVMYTTGGYMGILILSYDGRTSWPCDEPDVILPANDPAAMDYAYYYNPRNCHSQGNQIYNNTIHGFAEGIRFYSLVEAGTIIRNNAVSGWARGWMCSPYACESLAGVLADHNVTSGTFGFVDLANHDFRLAAGSPLINAGAGLGALNPDDYAGQARPQGGAYDVGAYEYVSP